MTPDAIQIIRDEHRAVASMLQSLSVLAEQGPGDKPQRFFEVLRAISSTSTNSPSGATTRTNHSTCSRHCCATHPS